MNRYQGYDLPWIYGTTATILQPHQNEAANNIWASMMKRSGWVSKALCYSLLWNLLVSKNISMQHHVPTAESSFFQACFIFLLCCLFVYLLLLFFCFLWGLGEWKVVRPLAHFCSIHLSPRFMLRVIPNKHACFAFLVTLTSSSSSMYHQRLKTPRREL